MKTLQKQLAIWTIALVGILAFTSCDEDWWDNWDARVDLPGQWEIREVSGWSGCPYQRGDVWTFYRNGSFYGDGYGGLHESGYWQIYGRTINFMFDGNTSMRAYIRNFDHDYMTLDVTDYTYNVNYTLRLTKGY